MPVTVSSGTIVTPVASASATRMSRIEAFWNSIAFSGIFESEARPDTDPSSGWESSLGSLAQIIAAANVTASARQLRRWSPYRTLSPKITSEPTFDLEEGRGRDDGDVSNRNGGTERYSAGSNRTGDTRHHEDGRDT